MRFISELKYGYFSHQMLKVPILLIVGEKDDSTPINHQKILYDALSCNKELHIIKGAEHTFREKNELEELKRLFDTWIKEVNFL